jgi:hypothetical protein
MARRKRVRTGTVEWNGNDWRRAWKIALTRIHGAPAVVMEQMAFNHAVDMLDCGFARGDAFQFQLGMLMMIDCCNEAILRGDCYQWWIE